MKSNVAAAKNQVGENGARIVHETGADGYGKTLRQEMANQLTACQAADFACHKENVSHFSAEET
jgi:hypothetical protein